MRSSLTITRRALATILLLAFAADSGEAQTRAGAAQHEPLRFTPQRSELIRPAAEETAPALQPAEGPRLQPARTAQPEIAAQSPATTASEPAAHRGARLVTDAYQLTKTAKSEAELTQIITLCVGAIRAGLNEEATAYARRLSAWAFNRRGELRAAEGREDDALADFDKAVQIDAERWQSLHNRGISYALHGRFKEALQDFNRVVQLQPDYANVYFNRGEVRYELGQFEGAIENYSMALQLNPKDSASFNSRGHAHYRLSDYRKAAADYTAALKTDPTNAAAFTNRGDLFADLGYYERALNDYQAAIKHDPQLARAYQSAAWLLATCPEEKFRSATAAVQAAQRAIELDPAGDHRYLDTLAAAQANAGQYEQARQTVRSAMQAAPKEAAAIYHTRLELYARSQPLRTQARELPQVADRSESQAQPSNFEQPVE